MLIIDGSGILNTQYFGQKNATPEQRIPAANATVYFIKKMINTYAQQYAVVVLDQSRQGTFRKQLYPEYKAHRAATEPELIQQKERLLQLLTAERIPFLQSQEFEADDFAGTLVKQYSAEESIIMISKDQDYLQLVGPTTSLWLMKTESQIDELEKNYGKESRVNKKMYCFNPEMVKKVYGLEPKQIIDWKALTGDSSDNIPGVKQLGNAAIPLLQYYGRVEDLYLEIAYSPEGLLKTFWKEQLGIKPAKYKYLVEQEEQAYLSKKLAAIYCDIPLEKKY